MDLMHEEPEPTPEERDHDLRRRVVIALLSAWVVVMAVILARAV